MHEYNIGEIEKFLRENLPWILKTTDWFLEKLPKLKRSYNKNKKKKKINRRKKAIFRDNLTNALMKWSTIEGDPEISNLRGKLPHVRSLLLKERQGSRRDTFIGANNVNIKDGEIECDIYCEIDSLVNLIIRADSNWNRYYMVRLDSRHGQYNGVLIDPGNRYWDFIPGGRTSSNITSDFWHHVKVVFQGSQIRLYVDRRLVQTIRSREIFSSGNIGIFNEIGRVSVNNFIIRKL